MRLTSVENLFQVCLFLSIVRKMNKPKVNLSRLHQPDHHGSGITLFAKRTNVHIISRFFCGAIIFDNLS